MPEIAMHLIVALVFVPLFAACADDSQEHSRSDADAVDTRETPDITSPETPDITSPETPDVTSPETPDVASPETREPDDTTEETTAPDVEQVEADVPDDAPDETADGEVVDDGPAVAIITPLDLTPVSPADALVVEAAATATAGRSIVAVTFWRDGLELARDDTPPYRACLGIPAATDLGGVLVIEARAVDSAGREATSDPRALRVVEDAPSEDHTCCPADAPPGNPRCGALQPVGEPVELCVGLSTEPQVVPRRPALAAAGGTFVVTCMPSATVAAPATAWRVERVAVDGTHLEPLVGPAVITGYLNDARVAFDGTRFFVATEHDANGSPSLYVPGSSLHAFGATGPFEAVWSGHDGPGGGGFHRAVVPVGGTVHIFVAGWGSATLWTNAAEGTLTRMSGAASAFTQGVPTEQLEAVFDGTGIQLFDASHGKVWSSRRALDGSLLRAPVIVGTQPHLGGFAVLRAAGTTFLAVDGLAGATHAVVTIDDEDGAVVTTAAHTRPAHQWTRDHGQGLYADGDELVLVQPTDTGLEATVFGLDLAPRPQRDGAMTLEGASPHRSPYHLGVACDASGTCAAVYQLAVDVWLQRFRGPVVD